MLTGQGEKWFLYDQNKRGMIVSMDHFGKMSEKRDVPATGRMLRQQKTARHYWIIQK